MIQPYIIITRLHTRNKGKQTVVFRNEFSMFYRSICIKYIHINLVSLRNKDDKTYIVRVFKVVQVLGKKTEFYFGC